MTDVSLYLLGPFQAFVGSELITDFPTDKVRALLAYLAVETEKLHRRRRLAGLFWPDKPDAEALNNLRKALYRLRKVLDRHAAGLSDSLLAITRQTIRLHASAIKLDVTQFRTLSAACKAHPHTSLAECQECLERLEKATELYRGEFLEGFSTGDAYLFNEWLSIERESVYQEYMKILEILANAYEQRGENARAEAFATRALQLDPWREETHRQIMRLLAQSGRRSEALAQYDTSQRILKQELGVEPDEETQELYRQIKSGAWPVSNQGNTAQSLHYFPTQFTPFIGRETELDKIIELLSDSSCRLITLVGPGGIGKTRLSIQAAQLAMDPGSVGDQTKAPNAHKAVSSQIGSNLQLTPTSQVFLDGIYFIPTEGIHNCDMLETALAIALNIHDQSAENLHKKLLARLRSKKLLLVLDGFEHLVACSNFLEEILGKAQGVKILTTSRQPLYLQPERSLQIQGLDYPSIQAMKPGTNALRTSTPAVAWKDYGAMRLFIQSAQRVYPGFSPQGTDLDEIAKVCRLLDGLPLAIEIAGAWVRVLDMPALAQQVAQNLDLLTAASVDVSGRHKSMRAVLEHSWHLLSTEERDALTQTSIFRSGFSLQAFLQITQYGLMQLATLLDKSLLKRTGEQRYELHSLTQQFAREKLAAQQQGSLPAPQKPQVDDLYRRHSQYYLDFIARLGPQLSGHFPQRALSQIRIEMDNLRQAWQWAVAHLHLKQVSQAMAGLSSFYRFAGLFQEGEQALAAAIHALDSVDTPDVRMLSQLLAQHSEFLADLGRYNAGLHEAERSLAMSRDLTNPISQIKGLLALGRLHENGGDYELALTYLRQARRFCEADNSHDGDLAVAFNRTGRIYWRQGIHQDALENYRQALQIQRRLGNRDGEAQVLNNMGLVYQTLSDYDRALDCFKQGVKIAEELSHLEDLGKHINNMGQVYWQIGNHTQALYCFQKALAIARQIGHSHGQHVCLANIGIIHREKGEYDQALQYYMQALAISHEMGFKDGIARTNANIGNVHRERGEYGLAKAYYDKALKIDQEIGNLEGVARIYGYLAILHREQQDYLTALQYLERSIPLLRQMGMKYYLTWQLVDKARVLMALGHFEAAGEVNKEGLQIALNINRKEYIFHGQLVEARLSLARGDIKTGQAQLDALLERARNEEEGAIAHYFLGQISGVAALTHKRKALKIFRELFKHTPKAEYRRFIHELETSLAL